MRLIDADALIKELDKKHYSMASRKQIYEQPTIDAVEVVRCNECLNSYKCCDGTLRCDNSYGPDNMDREVSASWFCANGERKDLSLGIKTIDKEV